MCTSVTGQDQFVIVPDTWNMTPDTIESTLHPQTNKNDNLLE
jgi:hypothetical protein